MNTRIVTAETEEGCAAIEEVMAHSYRTELEGVPSSWWRALLVDDVPVSYIRIDPDAFLPLRGGTMRAAFVADVATREDRRREGHFRRLMEMTWNDVRAVGISVMTLHGSCRYYRPLGFDVWTHHSGVFITPDLIELHLGRATGTEGQKLLEVADHPQFVSDLLVIEQLRAATYAEAKSVLQAAAALARERGKARILFEHPHGHTPRVTADSHFTEFARACGAQVILGGADSEGRCVDHADWLKVVDAFTFMRDALPLLGGARDTLPQAAVCFNTDAGAVTVKVSSQEIVLSTERPSPHILQLTWPASTLAHLVSGYKTAAVLAEMHGAPLPADVENLLDTLFPRRWCFSRNEEWVFTQ